MPAPSFTAPTSLHFATPNDPSHNIYHNYNTRHDMTEAGADDGINMIEASGLLLCCLQTRTGVKFVITWVYVVWFVLVCFVWNAGMERCKYRRLAALSRLFAIVGVSSEHTNKNHSLLHHPLSIHPISTHQIVRNQEHATPNKYYRNYTSSTPNAHW